MFTFPVFMMTYIPIALVALVKKCNWKPIKHSISVDVAEPPTRQAPHPKAARAHHVAHGVKSICESGEPRARRFFARLAIIRKAQAYAEDA